MPHLKCIGTIGVMWGRFDERPFTKSLVDLVAYSQRVLCAEDEYINIEYAPHSYHETARNWLVEHCNGEWLFQVDTDHVFAPDLLERLLVLKKRHKARVISGLYLYKAPPHLPVARVHDAEGKGLLNLNSIPADIEIMPVATVGAGCLLVDLDVYQEVAGKHLGTAPFNIIAGLSEDYSFCKRCEDIGITVYLAPRVESHHLRPPSALWASDVQNPPLFQVPQQEPAS